MKWPLKTIGSVGQVKGGKRLPKGAFVQESPTQHPYLRVVDFREDGINRETIQYITPEVQHHVRRYIVQKDDIYISIAGTIGRVGIIPEDLNGANLTENAAKITGLRSEICPRYLTYFLRSELGQARIANRTGGTSQPKLALFRIETIDFPTPPLPIQTRIADILSAYDDLIENNKRRMQLLEESARQLYREWFVRLRFPGHEHTKIVNGLPEGWEKPSAFDCINIMSGGTPKTTVPGYWDGEIPFYTPKDAVDGIWVTDCERRITEEGLNKCNSRLYRKGTVFISARGTVGKLNIAQCSMAMSQSCYGLEGRNGISDFFLYSAMKAGVEELKQQAVGAVFDAIIVDTFKRIPFLLPTASIREAFEDSITPAFHQIENLTLQNQKLRAARDLLLPKLMNGEIAV